MRALRLLDSQAAYRSVGGVPTLYLFMDLSHQRDKPKSFSVRSYDATFLFKLYYAVLLVFYCAHMALHHLIFASFA